MPLANIINKITNYLDIILTIVLFGWVLENYFCKVERLSWHRSKNTIGYLLTFNDFYVLTKKYQYVKNLRIFELKSEFVILLFLSWKWNLHIFIKDIASMSISLRMPNTGLYNMYWYIGKTLGLIKVVVVL